MKKEGGKNVRENEPVSQEQLAHRLLLLLHENPVRPDRVAKVIAVLPEEKVIETITGLDSFLEKRFTYTSPSLGEDFNQYLRSLFAVERVLTEAALDALTTALLKFARRYPQGSASSFLGLDVFLKRRRIDSEQRKNPEQAYDFWKDLLKEQLLTLRHLDHPGLGDTVSTKKDDEEIYRYHIDEVRAIIQDVPDYEEADVTGDVREMLEQTIASVCLDDPETLACLLKNFSEISPALDDDEFVAVQDLVLKMNITPFLEGLAPMVQARKRYAAAAERDPDAKRCRERFSHALYGSGTLDEMKEIGKDFLRSFSRETLVHDFAKYLPWQARYRPERTRIILQHFLQPEDNELYLYYAIKTIFEQMKFIDNPLFQDQGTVSVVFPPGEIKKSVIVSACMKASKALQFHRSPGPLRNDLEKFKRMVEVLVSEKEANVILKEFYIRGDEVTHGEVSRVLPKEPQTTRNLIETLRSYRGYEVPEAPRPEAPRPEAPRPEAPRPEAPRPEAQPSVEEQPSEDENRNERTLERIRETLRGGKIGKVVDFIRRDDRGYEARRRRIMHDTECARLIHEMLEQQLRSGAVVYVETIGEVFLGENWRQDEGIQAAVRGMLAENWRQVVGNKRLPLLEIADRFGISHADVATPPKKASSRKSRK